MKVDRFVKVMLVAIAILLAINCTTNLNAPGTDAQAQRPSAVPFAVQGSGIFVFYSQTGGIWRYEWQTGGGVLFGTLKKAGDPIK